MKLKVLVIIAILLLLMVGCALTGGTLPQKTPAELEQLAKDYQNDGFYDESSEIYHQLLDANPSSFDSVRYQHEILINAEAQSDIRLLFREMLNTFWLLDSAEREHYAGMTPETLEQEKKWFDEFVQHTNHACHLPNGYQANPSIWCVYFSNLIIRKYHPEDEEMGYVVWPRYNSIDTVSVYYDRLFDLYELGILKSPDPLDVITLEITKYNVDPMDAIVNVGSAYYYCNDDIYKGTFTIEKLEQCDYQARSRMVNKTNICPFPSREQISAYKDPQAYPISECHQKYIHSYERFTSKRALSKDILEDTLDVARVYEKYKHYEQARMLYWKVIDAPVSDDTPRQPIIDGIESILYSFDDTKQYDELKDALQRISQNAVFIDKYYTYLHELAEEYKQALKICEDPSQRNYGKTIRECYENDGMSFRYDLNSGRRL